MSPEALLEVLAALARELGLEVRRVPPAAAAGEGGAASSGVCRLRERVWVLLSPADPPARRAEVLAGALRDHAGEALESRYLPPAVRAQLERVEGARGAGWGGPAAPDPGSGGAT